MARKRHNQQQLLLQLFPLLLVVQLPFLADTFAVRGPATAVFAGVSPSARPLDKRQHPPSFATSESNNLLSPQWESNPPPPASPEALKRVEQLVNKHKLFVFLKGTPEEPKCGFSRVLVQALQACGVDEIPYLDVLSEPETREAVKVFGNWETFPQLYVQQELIGGSDIVVEMFRNKTLHSLLQQHGLV